MVNPLERYHLGRYCDKYGLDYQEIDSSLTFGENKKHLRSLVRMLCNSLDAFELARMESLREEYMENHALSYYAYAFNNFVADFLRQILGRIYYPRFLPRAVSSLYRLLPAMS